MSSSVFHQPSASLWQGLGGLGANQGSEEPWPGEQWLLGFLTEHALWLCAFLLGLLLIQSIRLWLSRTLASRRVARHRSLGQAGEQKAVQILLRNGYEIMSEQASARYQLLVDGQPHQVNLRADFLVRRRGLTYVAEAKSGVESAKLGGRATRRQLLEYLFAFEIDGVLLVDVQAKKVRTVQFPR